MELDWIISEPIDYEHKQYKLLAFVKEVDERFDKFQIYPSFKELSIHLANIKSISADGNYIKLKKNITEIDEEILIGDLNFLPLPKISAKDIEEFHKIVKFAESKITEYFLIGKSLWSLVNESIEISNIKNKKNIRSYYGFIIINYDNIRFFYQYECFGSDKKDINLKNIYIGNNTDDHEVIIENVDLSDENFKNEFEKHNLTIFEISVSQLFDFEHSVKPLVKRKVLSYIRQNTNK